MFKQLFDISWPITEKMTAYKDNRVVSINSIKTVAENGVHESLITLGSHTGTHVDAPKHFVADGKPLGAYTLEQFIGKCVVVDLTHLTTDAIYPEDIASYQFSKGDRVLFKTRNSAHKDTASHDYHFIFIHHETAFILAQAGVLLVGIDYLGVERGDPEHKTHSTLFDYGVLVLEGLRLYDVPAGRYLLMCLPLSLPDLDAAPARVVLATLE